MTDMTLYKLPDIDDIIALALAEDLGIEPSAFALGATGGHETLARDVTSFSAIGLEEHFAGRVVARQDAVVAGLPMVGAVYDAISRASGLFDAVEVFPLVAEGTRVGAGTAVLEVEGVAAAVLAGERTALDFLMLLSGIATETARWVEASGGGIDVCDTRKTVPGLRALSKYAVAVGGGTNHRRGLWDMVLIKDNHIRAAGGITDAVTSAKLANPYLLVEVEADTLAQAKEAVEAGADLVLLDNMADDLLAEAVLAVRQAAEELGRSVLTEASGGITIERMPGLRASGVDRVSTSALTLGVSVIDFGLDEN